MSGRRSADILKGKASVVPEHPGPDADGVTRVIPKEVWDGPHGDFLREIGAAPDDPSNLLPTQEGVQARFDELRGQQEAFVASLNKQLPESAKVIPWAMIPWSVWSQQHTDFLLAICELFPVSPWNTMLLPEDERGAFVLGLPQHLRGSPPGLEEAANRVIGEIRERLAKVHEDTAAALGRGDTAGLDAYAKAREEATGDVIGLAHVLAARTYGDEAYARHKELFGGALGWRAGD